MTPLEAKNLYWRNYTRKLNSLGMQNADTQRARALYVQSVVRYYSSIAEGGKHEG
jgi:hypothetical protein